MKGENDLHSSHIFLYPRRIYHRAVGCCQVTWVEMGHYSKVCPDFVSNYIHTLRAHYSWPLKITQAVKYLILSQVWTGTCQWVSRFDEAVFITEDCGSENRARLHVTESDCMQEDILVYWLALLGVQRIGACLMFCWHIKLHGYWVGLSVHFSPSVSIFFSFSQAMRKRVFQHYCESLLTLTAITQSHLHPVCYHFTGCPFGNWMCFFFFFLAGLHKLTLLSKVTVKVFGPKIPSHVVLCTDSVNWESSCSSCNQSERGFNAGLCWA